MHEVGAVATIITSFALGGAGIVIAVSQLRNRNTDVSGAWFFIVTCFALALWLLANTASDADPDRALFWVRVSFASIAVGLTTLLLFVNRFPIPRFVSKVQTLAPFAVLACLLPLIASPLIIPTVTFKRGVSTVEPGVLYGIFVVFVVVILGFTLQRLVRGMRLGKRYRAQVRIILAGVIATAAVALVTNLLLPLLLGNNDLYWLASVSTLGFVAATAYAIIKEGLFDVRLAVMRSITYVVSLVTIIGIYYATVSLVARVIMQDQSAVDVVFSPLTILPALIFLFTFQPVKRFFDRLTNKLFFRDRYKSEDFFAEFGQLLASTTDLRSLLERASERIGATFKAEQVLFHLYYGDDLDRHMTVGTRRHTKLPQSDAELLNEYSRTAKKAIILTDYVDELKVRRMLSSHRVALVMPLIRGDRVIGYLMLGDHRSGYYTNRDLVVLAGIGNGLIVAIQNALSLHEVKELNATLQQRIDVATKELRSYNAQLKHLDEVKDEFISMASHQLRTPLTSVKGYISMVLDGDAGKITPQQQKLLTEAFSSSERMVHLIADFLNVSRLQTGRFMIEKSLIDIKKVVSHEVENLTVMANGHGMKLKFVSKSKTIAVMADESKMREVIMNYIDNAIYYSKPGSTITVSFEQVPDGCEMRVTDTGIGVPKEEQARLFNKFFRATNARKQRPDGTGVGLYLARRVITGHGGKIIFESTEGKGSTFGFWLPTKSDQ